MSEAEIKRRLGLLESAMIEFQDSLLLDIRLYLRRFKLEDSPEKAKGVWHDVVNVALRSAKNYDPELSARAWLRGVALNVIRHLKRTAGNRISTVFISDAVAALGFDGNIEVASETELFDHLAQRNAKRYFRGQFTADEILSVVNEDDRTILRMRFVKGLSTREIAAHLGVNEGAANVRLSRAKRRLQREYLK